MNFTTPHAFRLFCRVLLATTFSISLNAQLPVNDFQIWHETTIIKPIAKTKDKNGKEVPRLSLLFLGTLRLGQNRLYPVDRRVGAGFDLRLNDNFSITPTYVYRYGEPGRRLVEIEHRLRFDLNYTRKFSSFTIKNRNRVEHRIRNSRRDTTRFRNKFTFQFPVKQKGKELFSPFIASEPYYEFTLKRWTSHEFSAGISKKLSDSLSTEIFYLHRNTKAPFLKHINGIGVNLKILLP